MSWQLTLPTTVGHTYFSEKAYKINTHNCIKMTVKLRTFDFFSGIEHLLIYVLDTYSIPCKELDVLDENGDTALHVAARESRCSPQVRFMVIKHLLQREANTRLTNHKGKSAIDIIPKNEEICRRAIHDRMIYQQGKHLSFIVLTQTLLF